MDCVGEALCDPLGSTFCPSSVASSAFSVFQLRVVDWPRSIEVGFADKVAVTGLGCGGGVVVTLGGCFLAQPLIAISNANVPTNKMQFFFLFTSCPPNASLFARLSQTPEIVICSSSWAVYFCPRGSVAVDEYRRPTSSKSGRIPSDWTETPGAAHRGTTTENH